MSPNDPRHGTPAGRTAHQRDDETPCQSCQDSFRAYENARHRRDRTDYRHAGYHPDDGLRGGRWMRSSSWGVVEWVQTGPTRKGAAA